eukprot:CAMPEP_0115137014 /NCGR_PEP_ID=MMETSP0227-20121206/56728_1 /TAXON_ID=89957 /ORGANISM="Polarella glacialis, Strain CCMP 1383" /LENGTH=65 /DNA_ID=CAMNT_0002544181 /DNA_START=45 /DNA_END=242 /DNA_ORIENTATION=-
MTPKLHVGADLMGPACDRIAGDQRVPLLATLLATLLVGPEWSISWLIASIQLLTSTAAPGVDLRV